MMQTHGNPGLRVVAMVIQRINFPACPLKIRSAGIYGSSFSRPRSEFIYDDDIMEGNVNCEQGTKLFTSLANKGKTMKKGMLVIGNVSLGAKEYVQVCDFEYNSSNIGVDYVKYRWEKRISANLMWGLTNHLSEIYSKPRKEMEGGIISMAIHSSAGNNREQ